MDIHVDEAILKKTTKCIYDFSCLKDQTPHCEVIHTVASNVLVTFCQDKEPCPYCKPFHDSKGFCTCRVRIELYNKYGI